MAEERSGSEKLSHRLPAQASCSTHFNHNLETRLPSAKIAKRKQFRPRQNLTFQQPKNNRLIAKKSFSELGHHFLNLSDRSTTPNALVTQMRRTHAVFLKQKNFRVTKPTRRTQLRAVAGCTQTAEQSCFGTPFERCMNSHASRGLQLTAETPT